MNNDNVQSLKTPAESNPLQDILREGARKLLAQAVESEITNLLENNRSLTTENGKQAIVRNGYLPERTIQTGLGDIAVKIPKVRDRTGSGLKFNSSLVPPYLKRTKAIEEFLPWLYLKGISTGDFTETMQSLLGKNAPGLSSNTICRLKKDWITEHNQWQKRDLSKKQYVYIWADGVYTHVRQDDKLCLLVMIGSTQDGKKELLGLHDGYRESTDSWAELIIQLKSQGLNIDPKLLTGDGAMGLWAAANKHWADTPHQRCWVHKTANILNKLPKSMQPKVKESLQNIWMAETKKEAEKAYQTCIKKFEIKYPKAMHTLAKDKDEMLAFYQFPAEHWGHIRTTNPIESVFATVRHRGKKTKNCGNRETTLSMTFKLIEVAQNRWRRLKGYKLLADVLQGVNFKDGIKQQKEETKQNVQSKDAA